MKTQQIAIAIMLVTTILGAPNSEVHALRCCSQTSHPYDAYPPTLNGGFSAEVSAAVPSLRDRPGRQVRSSPRQIEVGSRDRAPHPL